MASHQHHCNHHPPPPPPPPPSHFCCGCGCGCSPSITPTDPLLQALATHLLQSQSPPHYSSSSSSSSYLLKPHQSKSPSYKYQQPTNTSHSQSQPLLHSLAGRVAALESSLQRLSLSSPNTVKDFSFSSVRLRDVAARTIQTHFRAFLARRSQTLRQLRLLAGIRANLASLKASCSDGAARFRAAALSQKAADLLVKLDSIQSVDLMIREGKRSVGAELVQFLELMDGIARRVFSSKMVRKVSFADNAKANKMHTREPEIESDEHSEVSSDDQLGFVETLGKVAEGNKEFSVLDDEGAHVELERFHQLSDDDLKKYRVDLSGEGSRPKNGAVLEQIFNGGLSAPVPVQMEPRGSESDLMQKRKVVRILSP